ncbi:fructokinase [Palleronia aestuarii]|uniref:Fructokinase n=1 Tax=Palleronia aestuarii TaxID=568105 RepID=A0A2W7N240_9RHOB|nr:sugar kinase [Palleronia aestuarii]PZX13763.1 fructokinase [Palleronia aestuarii]
MTLAPDSLGPTLVIGELLVEIVATTLGEGFRETQDLIGPYPSGAPAIFASQSARIGGSTAMAGGVGRDDFGRILTERLEADGVDLSAVLTDPALPTGTAFVRYRPDGGRDFVYNMWTSAAGSLTWTDALAAVAERAGHVHVMGTLLPRPQMAELIERAAGIVKRRGGTVSFDPNLRKELMEGDEAALATFERMIDLTDLLLPSGEELLAAGRTDTPREAVSVLLDRGIKEIALKEGVHGATGFRPDADPVHVPAFEVDEVDPTGAGDCFGGAYVAARRIGLGIEEALTYGAAAGARNVAVRGPMEGAGSRADLDAFIAETPRRSA